MQEQTRFTHKRKSGRYDIRTGTGQQHHEEENGRGDAACDSIDRSATRSYQERNETRSPLRGQYRCDTPEDFIRSVAISMV